MRRGTVQKISGGGGEPLLVTVLTTTALPMENSP